ncbi:MAG: isoaspartyl peptidase/L-asparaginase-like protein (Ntn-hydrolase superfamily) [Vicingaceae bacterium]|jgi:isoaspartyl peptidase/L-asparaginase-like protein (Ntn-hydrolase superfamily)
MSAEKEAAHQNVRTLLVNEGEKVLKERGSAISAVIKVMGDSILFDASRGSVLPFEMHEWWKNGNKVRT